MSLLGRLILVAIASALFAGGVQLLGDGDESGPAERPFIGQRGSAQAFVDSIGVAMHLHYVDTAYARQPEVFARLDELGVRHIREGVPVRSPALDKGLPEAARRGLRATLVGEVAHVAPEEGVVAGIRAMGSQVDAFEAPNELDIFGPPDWRERLSAYLPAFREAVRRHAPDVPVVGPSFVNSTNYERVDRDAYDVANFHPYPGALPPEGPIEQQVRRADEVVPGKRITFTETGYHNALAATEGQPPASEPAAAVYLPRALLWSFAAGVERTIIYELLDEKPDPGLTDPEQHFGLLRQDFSPKPAFLAIRNLIRAVRESPGAAAADPPLPSVRSDERVHRVVLQRRDGSRIVALWRPVSVWDRYGRQPNDPGRTAVEIAWPRPARDMTVTRPSVGAGPTLRRAAAASLRLELEGDVVLLSYR